MLNGTGEATLGDIRSPSPFQRAQRLARDINRQLMRSIRKSDRAGIQRHARCALLEAASALDANPIAIDTTLGALPFFIVDFSFSDEAFWSRLAHRQPVLPARESTNEYFELVSRASLAKNTLTAAWVVCNHAPTFAPLACGLRRSTAELLASIELENIDQLALQHAARLRPRWSCNDRFWRLLSLTAARGESTQSVIAYGLRQLAAERWMTRRDAAGIATISETAAGAVARAISGTDIPQPRTPVQQVNVAGSMSCPSGPLLPGSNP